MSGLVAFPGARQGVIPNASAFAVRRFLPPVAAPASGFADYWRAGGLGNIPGTLHDGQAMLSSQLTYPIDTLTQTRLVRFGVTGFTSMSILVIDPFCASTQPLIATGQVSQGGLYRRVTSFSQLYRWTPGAYGPGTSGDLHGFFFFSAGSGFYSYTNPLSTNIWMGLARGPALGGGVSWGYCNGVNPPVLNALPLSVIDPTVFAFIEHRFYAATATRNALYELRINNARIGAVDFGTPGTPRYNFTNDRGLIHGLLRAGNGVAGNIPSIEFRDWSIVVGYDDPSTLDPTV